MPQSPKPKTYDKFLNDYLIHADSPLKSFEFTESLAFDQAYEGVPMMNVGQGSNSQNFGDYSRLDVFETHLAHEDIERGDAVAFVEGNTHAADFERDSDQYLRAADSASLSVLLDLTIEAWVKIESQVGNTITADDYYTIVSKSEHGAAQFCYAFVYGATAGVPFLEIDISDDGSTVTQKSVNHTLTVGEWTHVAVVFTAGVSIEFFVNGVSIGVNTLGIPNSIFVSNRELRIGATEVQAIGLPGGFFDGQIDDVRIWSEARSSTEILENYNRQLTGLETNLAAYWRLNNSLLDQTANNNDLTNVNSVTFVQPGGFGRTQDGVALARADITGLYETFIGFALRRMLSGHKDSIQVGGTATFLSGLEPATQYYLSDAPGEISTTPGTNSRKVGISGDEKSIVVTNLW